MDTDKTDESPYPVMREVERKVLELCDLEKRRIGQDLHDGIGQLLTGIHLMSKTLERRLRVSRNSEADVARSIADLVDDTIQHVRRIVAGMAPPELENQDAAAALQMLCNRAEEIHQIQCAFNNRLQEKITNPDAIKHLYFIAGEAIHNAIRHGKADQLEVTLTGSLDRGELIVLNNGNFDGKDFTCQSGIGVATMQCRAQALNGWLRLQPEENHSASVICRFSLMNEQES